MSGIPVQPDFFEQGPFGHLRVAVAALAEHIISIIPNAERQSRREATYSERSCSPGGPTC